MQRHDVARHQCAVVAAHRPLVLRERDDLQLDAQLAAQVPGEPAAEVVELAGVPTAAESAKASARRFVYLPGMKACY